MDITGWLLGAGGLVIGGILKGATGAGAPIVAVPLLSLLYSVPLAVATLTVPSLLANIFQIRKFRRSMGSLRFALSFAGSAAVGAAIGSVLLVVLSAQMLLVAVSVLVYLYVAFRLPNPGWRLCERVVARIVLPVGLVSGVLQGAAGLSAPASVTFLNAMRLDRERFIAVISMLFFAMSAIQIPALVVVGVMTWERFGLGLLACIPLFGAMPVGAYLARKLSREAFDKVMLAVLALVATRLVVGALW